MRMLNDKKKNQYLIAGLAPDRHSCEKQDWEDDRQTGAKMSVSWDGKQQKVPNARPERMM